MTKHVIGTGEGTVDNHGIVIMNASIDHPGEIHITRADQYLRIPYDWRIRGLFFERIRAVPTWVVGAMVHILGDNKLVIYKIVDLVDDNWVLQWPD